MPAGSMILTIAAILVFCGFLQRVLDRMYLTDRQALVITGAILLGTFIPDVSLGVVRIGIGGALIPLAVCIYLFIKADEPVERLHVVAGTIITAVSVYAVSNLLPAEAETLPLDPMWLYGLCGGVIAWLLGRSRRNAFICGIVGVILADMACGIIARVQGYQVEIVLGGGGIADAAVISGVTGVLLCELMGELIERLVRHTAQRSGGGI